MTPALERLIIGVADQMPVAVYLCRMRPLPGIEFRRLWILGATERSFPPPARQDPILLDEERAEISKRAGTRLAARADRGSEEELVFAFGCEAARERLVVSYARHATGESRPRLPSVFFREIASQLVGERVSAEEAPLLHRPDVLRIGGDAIGVPISGGRYAETAETVSAAAQLAISEADRDRTYLQVAVTRPVAIATFEQAAPAFGRALRAEQARRSSRYSEWDGALGPEALAAVASLVPPDRVLSPTALEELRRLPAAVPDGRRAAGEIGGGAGANGSDRQHVAAASSTGSSSGLRATGTARVRRRSLPTLRSGCARSRERSATAPRSGARPVIRRCGGRTVSR